MKKYQIIYADPPWSYKDKRTRPIKNSPGGAGGAEKWYKTMDIEDIKNFKISNISDDNCMLFLWATAPLLPEAFEVIKAWGFEYKTVGFVWVKMKKDKTREREGMGYYTMSNAEFVLIGLKGKYWRNKFGVRQILFAPKTKHSAKPPEIRNRIVEFCGDLPRIELFARKEETLFPLKDWNGWDVWGNEVDSDIEL